ncbi:hypothetical protein PGKDCPLP_03529 [Stenotrophomonas maltophilia]|nr:hypothetical protein PGKDCPLP_03529 [Stenotrophomonas maltophilia]
MVKQSNLWVHGQVHDSLDYRIGRGRVVCNPLGYPIPHRKKGVIPENPDFDPNFVIEV